MLRIRVVSSARLDQDVEAHLQLLQRLPRVQVLAEPRPVADQLPLIARDALTLWRQNDADLLLTVGEPALVATMLAWRGPLIHLPVGLLSRTELALLRWRGAQPRFATLFSTHTAANNAIERGLDSGQCRVVRTAPPPLPLTRAQVRQRLGIDADANVVTIGGRILRIRGHALSIWAAGILAFRDPLWRTLIDPGQHASYLNRYAASISRPGVTVLCSGSSATELAAAANVVLIDPGAVPSFTAIASAAAHRVPIVASAQMWQREQLLSVPALLMTDRKARHWARAAISSVEGAQSRQMDDLHRWAESATNEHALVHQWLDVIHAVCGRKRSLVA